MFFNIFNITVVLFHRFDKHIDHILCIVRGNSVRDLIRIFRNAIPVIPFSAVTGIADLFEVDLILCVIHCLDL